MDGRGGNTTIRFTPTSDRLKLDFDWSKSNHHKINRSLDSLWSNNTFIGPLMGVPMNPLLHCHSFNNLYLIISNHISKVSLGYLSGPYISTMVILYLFSQMRCHQIDKIVQKLILTHFSLFMTRKTFDSDVSLLKLFQRIY